MQGFPKHMFVSIVIRESGCCYRSREKRVLDSIAASFARRETRSPAFDFRRFIAVFPECRISVRRREVSI